MTWEQAGIALFAFAILCEQAHIASPIVRVWMQPGLRKIALSRWPRTVLLPPMVIAAAILAPFWLISCVYWGWNIWHFGAQHYGVGRLLGWRVSRWWYIALTSVLIMAGSAPVVMSGRGPELFYGPLWAPPLHNVSWWRWFSLVAIDLNHWLVDIGLSSWTTKLWWLFLGLVAAFGCIGFAWKVPRADHIATLAIPWVIQARWGVGIWHFDTSQWSWKLSDPRVRATIGKDLFA